MSTSQIWNNVIAYALQIGLLVGLGALAPALLRLRTPGARLLFWQALLIACVVLPWVQPWRQEVISVSNMNVLTAIDPVVTAASAHMPAAPVSASVHHPIPFAAIVLSLLAAGIVVRLIWLATGLARLAGYRRRGHELASDPVFKTSARCLVSDEISGPVTFGWRDPAVLLPGRFPTLRPELRDAILCHELIHIERRDWMFTLLEEFIRAVFWFHPAIWWVLGEIQLAREQTVDRAVIEITHAREPYVDALLAMAGATDGAASQLDLAPAPLFLRRRHLKQRVIGLLQEVQMLPLSTMRLAAAHTGAIAIIAGSCWLVSGVFPLAAAPQLVTDAAGVIVYTGDAKLIHRTPVAYPPEALEQHVQGKVVIEASVDADGDVSEDTVVRCPRELCDAAVDSLPNWRFDARQANTTRSISIDFVARNIMPKAPGIMASTTMAQSPRGVVTFVSSTTWLNGEYVSVSLATPENAVNRTLSDIRLAGLSDSASSQLRSRLPLQAGTVWSAATAGIVAQIVTGFDPRLEVDVVDEMRERQWILWIGPAAHTFSNAAVAMPPLPADVFAAGNGVRPPAVLSKVDPAYTDGAKSAGISGIVTLSVVVGADGLPRNIQVLQSLDPGLDQSAVEALTRWRFRAGAHNDGASVSTQAQVNFTFRVL